VGSSISWYKPIYHSRIQFRTVIWDYYNISSSSGTGTQIDRLSGGGKTIHILSTTELSGVLDRWRKGGEESGIKNRDVRMLYEVFTSFNVFEEICRDFITSITPYNFLLPMCHVFNHNYQLIDPFLPGNQSHRELGFWSDKIR